MDAGSRTLKDAINEAMRDWTENVATTHYVLGSALGPHPYPDDGARVPVGDRPRGAAPSSASSPAAIPQAAVACVGGGSNAIGLFSAYLARPSDELYGVEAGGRGPGPGEHAARFAGGSVGVLHGTRTMLLQDEDGPGPADALGLGGPRLSGRRPRARRARRRGPRHVRKVSDEEALDAFERSCRDRGDPAGARERARRRVRRRASRAKMPQSRLDPRQPLGPRRQGPREVRRARGAAGSARVEPDRARRPFAARRSPARGEPRGLRRLPDGRRSVAGRHRRPGPGARARRAPTCWSSACRSRDPDRRRPRPPARGRAGARRRARPSPTSSRWRAEIRAETALALVLFSYLNPLLRRGIARAARDARARPGSTASS